MKWDVVDVVWNMYSQSKMTGFSPEAWKDQARTISRLLNSSNGCGERRGLSDKGGEIVAHEFDFAKTAVICSL
jgi:hypothetical protein